MFEDQFESSSVRLTIKILRFDLNKKKIICCVINERMNE